MKQEEQYPKCCGTCAFFKFEDLDGDGTCIKNILDVMANCSNDPCKDYISQKELRFHLGTILYTRRVLWENRIKFRKFTFLTLHIPYLDSALKFAYNYIKTISNL